MLSCRSDDWQDLLCCHRSVRWWSSRRLKILPACLQLRYPSRVRGNLPTRSPCSAWTCGLSREAGRARVSRTAVQSFYNLVPMEADAGVLPDRPHRANSPGCSLFHFTSSHRARRYYSGGSSHLSFLPRRQFILSLFNQHLGVESTMPNNRERGLRFRRNRVRQPSVSPSSGGIPDTTEGSLPPIGRQARPRHKQSQQLGAAPPQGHHLAADSG